MTYLPVRCRLIGPGVVGVAVRVSIAIPFSFVSECSLARQIAVDSHIGLLINSCTFCFFAFYFFYKVV